MGGLTRDLGGFVAALKLQDVPPRGAEIARAGIADCFGVMVAGARDPEIALVDRELGYDGEPSAPLIPSGRRRSIETAALVNGVAAHVLDYDDVTLDGHPSAVLVPAILAQAHASGSSGAEILAAYIAGYEVWAELLAREPTPLHDKGWHPTTVRGTVAAAAACAKLRRLDASTTATAMAISASMASGLVANFGTMTKSFQVGRAAQSGLIAARLAAAGLTASLDALEHPSGYLAAFSPQGKAERDQPFVAARKEWHIVRQGLNIKRFPICYATHRCIDAALDLVERYDLAPDRVERIHVSTGRMQMLMLRNHRPQTGLEAKFSMEYAVSILLIEGKAGLEQFSDAVVQRPDVQAMIARSRFFVDPERNQSGRTLQTTLLEGNVIRIHMRDGRVITGKSTFAKGSPKNPMSYDEVADKFRGNAEFAKWPKQKAESVIAMVKSLESVPDMRKLTVALTG